MDKVHEIISISVTAQVVPCLVCDAPTDRVQGPEQWVRRGVSRTVVPIATNRRPGWGRGGE